MRPITCRVLGPLETNHGLLADVSVMGTDAPVKCFLRVYWLIAVTAAC